MERKIGERPALKSQENIVVFFSPWCKKDFRSQSGLKLTLLLDSRKSELI